MEDCAWEKVLTHGKGPSARSGAAAAVLGNVLVVFGGTEGRTKFLQDVHFLDLKAMRWLAKDGKNAREGVTLVGPVPSPRAYASLVRTGEATAVLFGGIGMHRPGGERFFKPVFTSSPMHKLDSKAGSWSLLGAPLPRRSDAATAEAPSVPPRRYGAVLALVGEQLVLFGGNAGRERLGDLWSFDLARGEWRRREPAGESPPPRAAAAHAVVEGRLYVHGGWDGDSSMVAISSQAILWRNQNLRFFGDLWELDPETWSWSRLAASDAAPEPRARHAACVWREAGGPPYIALFGGAGQAGELGDLWFYRVPTREWLPAPRLPGAPARRSGHALFAHGRSLYVLGGVQGQQSFTDLCRLQLPPLGLDARGAAARPERTLVSDMAALLSSGLLSELSLAGPGLRLHTWLVAGTPLETPPADADPEALRALAKVVYTGGADDEAEARAASKLCDGPVPTDPTARSARLAARLCALLDAGAHSDVALAAGGESVPAHRCVLAARSDFFKAMFTAGLAESAAAASGPLPLGDMDGPTLRRLVRHAYGGGMEAGLDPPALAALLAAADRVQLASLKAACEAGLAAHADGGLPEAAPDLLAFAETHGARSLRARCIEAIGADPARFRGHPLLAAGPDGAISPEARALVAAAWRSKVNPALSCRLSARPPADAPRPAAASRPPPETRIPRPSTAPAAARPRSARPAAGEPPEARQEQEGGPRGLGQRGDGRHRPARSTAARESTLFSMLAFQIGGIDSVERDWL